MTAPKLHHYVPQFHLRRFADGDGRPWVWDKQTDRVFPTLPGRIAAETHFYRLSQYEAVGHDAQAMEKQLSALEVGVAAITDQWLDWLPDMALLESVPIPRANRRTLAL